MESLVQRPLVEVIVNKNWETEPFLAAMTNPKLRSPELPFPSVINTPKDGDNRMSDPRARYRLSNSDVIVRCIEDLMLPNDNTSSSEAKYKVLPSYIHADNPDYIISVSTAESAAYTSTESSENGSVYIGGSFFLHDADPDNPCSHLIIPPDKVFIPNNMNEAVFALFGGTFADGATARFIPAVRHPAAKMTCLASPDYAAVGVINITDYSMYEKADKEAREAFDHYGPADKTTAVSIETTHGVVRLSSDKPILFVSPITDRYECFQEDVTDTQNYTVAFNAGICVGDMLVALNTYFGQT
ncbi:MAG: hypothetical protein LBC35_03125 [Coriobacteriales bacterium]|jgi:hypothetical protein|nr:hypothetical protein [Coriobacteriales bacterium]